MIRPICWRLGFEFINIMRICSRKQGDRVWYFAYGANLDESTLDRRKIRPFSSRPFLLKNYAIEFTRPGPFKGSAFASLYPSPGSSVPGRILELTRLDAFRMDFYELVPFLQHYERQWVHQDGTSFYFYRSTVRRQGLLPTRAYRDRIVKGYSSLGSLSSDFIDYLQNLEVAPAGPLTDEMEFVIRQFPGATASINSLLSKIDQMFLRFFLSFIYQRSFTERFIK